MKTKHPKLLLFVFILCLSCCIVGSLLHFSPQKEPVNCINHYVNCSNGEISFEAAEGLLISGITLSDPVWWDSQKFKEETKVITFMGLDIPIGKHQEIIFDCSRISTTNTVKDLSIRYSIFVFQEVPAGSIYPVTKIKVVVAPQTPQQERFIYTVDPDSIQVQ